MKKKNIKQLIVSSSPLLRDFRSNIVDTEALYGESIKLLDIQKNWAFCELCNDKYKGWIKTDHLGDLIVSNHRVSVSRTFIYVSSNIKSKIINYLSLGSKVYAKKYNKNWFKILLNENNNLIEGYILNNHIVPMNHIIQDWVSIAEMLIGTPYKWGGKNTMGIDCSALIQLSIETFGIIIPRDTVLQKNISFNMKQSYKKLSRGMLIFWDNHVGVMADEENIIHSNAYHMSTVFEKLDEVCKRAIKKGQSITHILETESLSKEDIKFF